MKFEEITDMAEQAMSKAMMQLMRSKDQAYITCVLLNLPRTFTSEVQTAGEWYQHGNQSRVLLRTSRI